MFRREELIFSLIGKEGSRRIKVLTGLRQSGKSTVLFGLFKEHLSTWGAAPDHILEVDLGAERNADLRDPERLEAYVRAGVAVPGEQYFVLIDGIELAFSAEELKAAPAPPARILSVLDAFLDLGNADVYVTGSSPAVLLGRVAAYLGERADVVPIFPISFREFCEDFRGSEKEAYAGYMKYGGLPHAAELESGEEKSEYLASVFEDIFSEDIIEQYQVNLPGVFVKMLNVLCSSVGTPVNDSRLARTIKTTRGLDIDPETVSSYLGYLEEAGLFSKARRYDVKRKKYYDYPSVYYCTDIGLRNARLGFREMEEAAVMKNIIYNELRTRGYTVDVGVVPVRWADEERKVHQKNCEIDFIARKGNKIYYIQSAPDVADPEKEREELRPLRAVRDFFRKILVSGSYTGSRIDEEGILRIGMTEFLLDENSLDS